MPAAVPNSQAIQLYVWYDPTQTLPSEVEVVANTQTGGIDVVTVNQRALLLHFAGDAITEVVGVFGQDGAMDVLTISTEWNDGSQMASESFSFECENLSAATQLIETARYKSSPQLYQEVINKDAMTSVLAEIRQLEGTVHGLDRMIKNHKRTRRMSLKVGKVLPVAKKKKQTNCRYQGAPFKMCLRFSNTSDST